MDIDKHRAFAQDIATVLRKHDAHSIDTTYRLSDDRVFEQGRMTFAPGRHGSDGTINLIVTTHIGNFKEERSDG